MSSQATLDNLLLVAKPIIARDQSSRWSIVSSHSGPYDNVTIQGRWAEDDNFYGIIAPLPIANVLIALQCELTRSALAPASEASGDSAGKEQGNG